MDNKQEVKIEGFEKLESDTARKNAMAHISDGAKAAFVIEVLEEADTMQGEAPELALLSVSSFAAIEKAQRFLLETDAAFVSFPGAKFNVTYLNQDGTKFEHVFALHHWPEVEVFKSSFRFLDKTKHDLGGVYSENIKIPEINQGNYLVMEWDVSLITEYSSDVFVTTATGREILQELGYVELIELNGESSGFSDLDEIIHKLIEIPEGYTEVAEKLDIRQDYNRFHAPSGVERSQYFYEFIGHDGVTPENIEDLICSAESYAEQAYDFMGAVNCAIEDVLSNA